MINNLHLSIIACSILVPFYACAMENPKSDPWEELPQAEKVQLQKDLLEYKAYIEQERGAYSPPKEMAEQHKQVITQGLPAAYCLGVLTTLSGASCSIQ